MEGFIYMFVNKHNSKCYVGQTRTLQARYKEHLYQANNGSSLPIHRAIKKYGEKSFEFKVLQYFVDCTKEQLDEAEIKFISKHQAYSKGYNCTTGGEGNNGLVHSEETKELLRAQSKQRYPKCREKLMEANKNRVYTEEQCAKMRDNLKKNAQPKAIEWHKSEEGLEWHRKLAERNKGKCFMPTYQHTCIECGKSFENHGKSSKYCSGACEQRYRRKYINKVIKSCEYCGKEFSTDKYDKARFCSPTCVNHAVRWKTKE